MSIAVVPPKTSQIRAFATTNPTLDERQLARRLGVLTSKVRQALGRDPKRRSKSTA